MGNPRFSGLGRVMRAQADIPAASAGEPDDETPEPDEVMPGEDDEECEAGNGANKKDQNMSDSAKPGAAAAAPENTEQHADAGATAPSGAPAGDDPVANARAEERKRVADVFASEHVKGREMAAAELLANSDMKADAIVAMLPKLTPAADADEGKQMLESMRAGANPDLGQGDDNAAQAADNHGWGKAHAKAAKLAGRASSK